MIGGSRDVHSRLGQRRSPSESPPSSDSEDSRRKRRRRERVGNWFSKLTRSIDGFEDVAEGIRLNFLKEKLPRPCRVARGKKRQGSPQAPTRKPPPRIAEKATQTTGHRKQSSETIQRPSSSCKQQLTAGQEGRAGKTKEQRVGNGYCEYHRQKGHTTNECVQLRQLIDKLVKEGRLDHLVKNIKEGKDKQRSGGKKDAPRDKADTIYMVQSWQRSSISFPTLAADNAVVEPLTIEINAAGHDSHDVTCGEHCRHTVEQ
ncbi:hypothetical protein Tco_0341329 [Tanacetum coccineum]